MFEQLFHGCGRLRAHNGKALIDDVLNVVGSLENLWCIADEILPSKPMVPLCCVVEVAVVCAGSPEYMIVGHGHLKVSHTVEFHIDGARTCIVEAGPFVYTRVFVRHRNIGQPT